MGSFYSSTRALENLLIGLGRSYHKDLRRVKKLAKHRAEKGGFDEFGMFMVEHAKLKTNLSESIIHGLGYYFPEHNKSAVARALMEMIENFDEQRASLPKTR